MLYFFSSDKGYANQLLVAVGTLVQNTNMTNAGIKIFDLGLEDINRTRLLEIFERIEFIKVAEKDITRLGIVDQGFSLGAYARLLMPNYVGDYSEVVYLDCDTLIQGDISKFNWKQSPAPVHAVRDIVPAKFVEQLEGGRYFNSGVLFLDFSRIDSELWFKRLKDVVFRHSGRVPHHDQGILNFMFDGEWNELSTSWNYMTPYHFLKNPIGKFLYGAHFIAGKKKKNDVIVFHLTSWIFNRPWNINSSHFMASEYYQYASKIVGNAEWYRKDTRIFRVKAVHYILRIVIKC